MKIENFRIKRTLYVRTDEEGWNEWMYDGEWHQLMGMSWETIDPPEELAQEFEELVKKL